MTKPARSPKYRQRQLTRLQREAAAADAAVATERLRALKAEFLARNPGALA